MKNQLITDYFRKSKRRRINQVLEAKDNYLNLGLVDQTFDGSKGSPELGALQASIEDHSESDCRQKVVRSITKQVQNGVKSCSYDNSNSDIQNEQTSLCSQHVNKQLKHRPKNHSLNESRRTDSDIVLIRKVFEQTQYAQQSDACIRALHCLIAEFEFHVFYEEFCRNTKCALQFEHANPKVKNILTTISAFLLSAKKKYSSESLKRRLNLNRSIGRRKKIKSTFDSSTNGDEFCENDENRDMSNYPNVQIDGFKNSSENNIITDEIIVMMNESTGSKRYPSKVSIDSKAQNNFSLNSSDITFNSSCSIEPEDAEDEQIRKIFRLFRNLLDFVISDVLLPFLCSASVNTRLNVTFLLLKLVNSIEDLDSGLFARLRSSLLERLIDKSPKVRSMAAVLLYRFQDHQLPNDAVQDGLIFHLKYDSSPSVRLACLNVVLVNKDTLPAILSKIRDCNERIREKVFNKLAKKIDFKNHLNKEQRLLLIRNGLNDRSRCVQQTFKKQVIPAWIRSYQENLVDLLMGLDLIDQGALNANETVSSSQSNWDLIEQFLTNYFDSSLSTSQSNLSKLHLIIVDFCKRYLDKEFLVKNEHFSAETFFLWCSLIKFLKRREDELDKMVPITKKKIEIKKRFVRVLEMETNFSGGQKIDQASENGEKSVVGEVQIESGQLVPNHLDAENHGLSEQSPIDENNNKTENSEIVLSDQIGPTYQKKNLSNDNLQLNLQNESLDVHGKADFSQEQEDSSLFGMVMPKFSKFVSFFRSFCDHLNLNVDEKSEELSSNRFMLKQLINLLANYEIADNSQKAVVSDLVEELFELNENTIKIQGYTKLIMNFAYQNAYLKNKKEFFEYSMELLQRLEAKINLEEERRNSEKISAKEIRDLELLNAKETIQIHELKDQIDEAVVSCQFDRAHELQKKIETAKQQCNRLTKQIQRMKNVLEYQEHRKNKEKTCELSDKFDITNYPIEHIKLLQIFMTALQNGLNNFHVLVNYGIDRYILPGIISTNFHVRLNALMALNEACCLNQDFASKFCRLYFEICRNDNNQIQNCALQGLIDQIIEHGVGLFYNCLQNDNECCNEEKHAENQPKKDQKEAERPAMLPFEVIGAFCANDLNASYQKSNGQQQSETLIEKSQFIEFSPTSSPNQQTREKLIKDIVRFLLSYTHSKDETLKCTSVMGICKLMLLGRIYSPKLLSELILLWFSRSTSQSLQQDIGTFLPIYCLELSSLSIGQTVSLPTHLTGQHSLLESFMVTVENVYFLERGHQLNSSFLAERSDFYDSEIDVLNVIDFMLNLLEPSHHAAIAIAFCEQILAVLRIEREDEYMLRESFATKYLIRNLHLFNLDHLEQQDGQRLCELLQAIRNEDRYFELKKASILKIEKFMQKFC